MDTVKYMRCDLGWKYKKKTALTLTLFTKALIISVGYKYELKAIVVTSNFFMRIYFYTYSFPNDLFNESFIYIRHETYFILKLFKIKWLRLLKCLEV